MGNNNIDFEMLRSLIEAGRLEAKATRTDVAHMQKELSGMREEIREGFAGLRAHDHAQHADHHQLEKRVEMLEIDMQRLRIAVRIESDDQGQDL